MPMPKLCFLIPAAILLPLLGCGRGGESPAQQHSAQSQLIPPSADRGPPPAINSQVKLAVLVVFDQLRGDYLTRWQHLLGPDGFARLIKRGAFFTNCYYPYATTTTGPGHASMLTGTCPDRHGIINNNWFDPHEMTTDDEEALGVYCAGSVRFKLVPSDESSRNKFAGSPERLLSPTVADTLKAVSHGHSKVYGLSLKDRSAILPVGKSPDGAFWFTTRFVSSTYYFEKLPGWVISFNASGFADQWFGQSWERFRSDIDYDVESGPDHVVGEGKGANQGLTFPHPFAAGLDKPSKKYYEAVANSFAGNDLLWAFTQACIREEKLGQRQVPDLLTISFSSNDLVGHCWGPDSQEVLDITLRSDALMAQMLKYLDDTIGENHYAIVLTSDHGICPIPEVAAAKGLDAKRILPTAFLTAAKHLADRFGPGQWIEANSPPWVYLNRRLLAAQGRTPEEVAQVLAEFLSQQQGVARVITRQELLGDIPETDVVARLVKRSFHPDRSGDVYILLKPYHLLGGPTSTGTTHGSPYDYDRHVPLIVYGPGVTAGVKDEPTTPQAAAAVLAEFLGIPPPRDAEVPVPKTLYGQ